MDFDKFVNSKFYSVFDYIYKLTIINILLVVTNVFTLVIFGLMPSLISAGIIIKDIKEGKDVNIIKSYFVNFKMVYKKSILLNIFFLMILFVFSFNIYYFYMLVATNDNFIIYFAMFLFVFIDILSLLTFLHSIYVFIFFPYLDGNKIIKYSILFSINYLVKNILLLLLLLITIVIALLFLYLIPIVIVSLFLYVFLLLFYFDYKSYITKDNNMILTCENLLFKHKTKQKLL
jgi:uncharacterized membrane protein YesL